MEVTISDFVALEDADTYPGIASATMSRKFRFPTYRNRDEVDSSAKCSLRKKMNILALYWLTMVETVLSSSTQDIHGPDFNSLHTDEIIFHIRIGAVASRFARIQKLHVSSLNYTWTLVYQVSKEVQNCRRVMMALMYKIKFNVCFTSIYFSCCTCSIHSFIFWHPVLKYSVLSSRIGKLIFRTRVHMMSMHCSSCS